MGSRQEYQVLQACGDQVVLDHDSAMPSKPIRTGSTKIATGLPHSLCTTHAEVFPDLMSFVTS